MPLYIGFPRDAAGLDLQRAAAADRQRRTSSRRSITACRPICTRPIYQPRGGYVAFLGRISPEKRPDRAIEIARALGIPLKIAAKVDKVDEAYFREEIEPLLDATRRRVHRRDRRAQQERSSWARRGRCCSRSTGRSRSGWSMIEAMACGTPVLAFRCGSVPEVIDDGVTGFIVDSDGGGGRGAAARAWRSTAARSGGASSERFTAARMAQDYVEVYRSLLIGVRSPGSTTATVPLPPSGGRATMQAFEDARCLKRQVQPATGTALVDAGSGSSVLHSGDRPCDAPAPHAQARRQLRGVRQPRRHRRHGRRPRRPLPLRHALSLPPRAAAQRDAAAAARLERPRRQFLADRRSDQSGHLCRPSSSCCRRTRCTSCARSSSGAPRPISGLRIQQSRRPPGRAARCRSHFASDFADLFEVRGIRRARRGDLRAAACAATTRSCSSYHGLDGTAAPHAADASIRRRASSRRALRSYRSTSSRARRDRSSSTVELRRGRAENRPLPFLRGLLRGAIASCARRPAARHGRDLERDLQRGAVPLDGRPLRC